jgi:hypothetical protein
VPWYFPPPASAFHPPVPPPPPDTTARDLELLQGGGDVSVALEPTAFFGSNAAGSSLGVGVLARYSTAVAGVDVGYMSGMPFPFTGCATVACETKVLVGPLSQGAFIVGGSFLHYGAEVVHQNNTRLYVMTPEVDFRLVVNTGSSQPVPISMAPGATLIGLRYTQCLGGSVCFLAEVRGPTLFAYIPFAQSKPAGTTFSETSIAPFGSVGASVSIGLGFN